MNITALIVTYNRLEKLKISIEATLALPFEFIVIVDNNSNDGTLNWLNSLTDNRIIVINTLSNIGGAGGFKFGIDFLVRSIKTDWVVLYDDDAWPDEKFYTSFECIEKSTAEIYCSKVIDREGNICTMNIPWRRLPRSFSENIAYLHNKHNFSAKPDQCSQVVTFSFVGCVLHLTVLKETYKLIYDDLFIYFDDVYYSYQLSLNNYKINYEPSLIINHDIDSHAKGPLPAWKIYYLVRNMLRSSHLMNVGNCFSKSFIILRMVKYLFMLTRADHKLLYIKFYIKGIFHGLRNIGGKKH